VCARARVSEWCWCCRDGAEGVEEEDPARLRTEKHIQVRTRRGADRSGNRVGLVCAWPQTRCRINRREIIDDMYCFVRVSVWHQRLIRKGPDGKWKGGWGVQVLVGGWDCTAPPVRLSLSRSLALSLSHIINDKSLTVKTETISAPHVQYKIKYKINYEVGICF